MRKVRKPLIVALAFAALAFAAPSLARAEDDQAVKTGRAFVDVNARSFTLFAYNPAGYAYIKHDYSGSRKLDDGTIVLNFKFHLKGSVYERYGLFDFYFDKNGKFEHVEGEKGTAVWKPWDVTAAYHESCKKTVKDIPAVANDVKLLKQVGEANQKQLCEIALKNGLMLK